MSVLHVYLWSEFLISSELQFNKDSPGRKKSILGLQNKTRKTESTPPTHTKKKTYTPCLSITWEIKKKNILNSKYMTQEGFVWI